MPSIQSNQSIYPAGLWHCGLRASLLASPEPPVCLRYFNLICFIWFICFFFGELSTSKPKGTRCLVSAPLALSLGAFLALCTISSVRFCKAKEGKNNRILFFSSFFFNCRGWLHDPVIFLHLEPQLFDPRLFAAFVTVILEGLKMSLKD